MQSIIKIAFLVLIAVEGVSAFIPQHKIVSPTFGLPALVEAPLKRIRNNNFKQVAAEASLLERRAACGDTTAEEKPVVGRALKLIIAGAPASGKGTQCAMIKDKYGVVHLSTGDMLRAAVAAGTDVGRKAKDFMDSGKLVPDEVMIGIVSQIFLD
jgi:Adenylate kinase